MIPACDGQTVRQTVRQTGLGQRGAESAAPSCPIPRQTVGQTESIIANTALCIASYADAL